MKERNPKITKEMTILTIGLVLVIGALTSEDIKQIFDWSTNKRVIYNIWSLVAILGGSYLVYLVQKGKFK